MKERPILYSGSMVRAILDGRKTQTRRLVSRELASIHNDPVQFAATPTDPHEISFWSRDTGVAPHVLVSVPYHPGDRLWVRETVRRCPTSAAGDGWPVAVFAADEAPTVIDTWPWQRDILPSIHMPRGVSRITLDVTATRVERLQAISAADAIAEGVRELPLQEGAPGEWWTADPSAGRDLHARDPVAAFRKLWASINSDRASWSSNPWVWVVEFKRAEVRK